MMNNDIPHVSFDSYIEKINKLCELNKIVGKVTQVVGLIIEAQLQGVMVGEVCQVELGSGKVVGTEVVGFRKDKALLMPFGLLEGIAPGDLVFATGKPLSVKVICFLWMRNTMHQVF